MIKIFIITERRADYSRFKPIMELIEKDDQLDYTLVVTGAHLVESMGYTKNEILNDGLRFTMKFKCLLKSKIHVLQWSDPLPV